MSTMPVFASAQRTYENMEPPEDVEQGDDGRCDDCAETQPKDSRIAGRWGE